MAVPLIGIVDDDDGVREAISSLIRSARYRTVKFPSAESFLSSERTHEIECLIVDFHLPGMDGLELRRVLAEADHRIPIILISSRAHEVRERALQDGVLVVFGKPFNDQALLGAIHMALRR